ncbi:MAG: beta strand repeat-containing protein [Fimbriiglobus sp.]
MTRRVLILSALLALAPPAAAQSFTWNLTGDGTWNASGSWNPNTGFPNSTTQSAVFGNGITTTTAAVGLTADVTVNTLTFDGITGTKAYTVGGTNFGITLGGASAGVVVDSAVTSTAEQTIASAVGGSGDVTVNGGRLTLSNNASTFTGAVNVNAGRLQIRPANQNDRPLGNASNTVTVASGGQLFVNAAGFNEMPYALTINGIGVAGAPASESGALRFGGFSPSRWTGPITLGSDASIRWSGSADVRGGVNLGANTLTFRGAVSEVGIVSTTGISGSGNVVYDASSTTVSVNSTYTGTTTLQSGFTFISTANALGQSLGNAANKVTVNGGAKLYLNGSAFNVGNKVLTLNGGELVANGNAKGWAGPIDLTANSTVGAEGINGTLNLTGGIATAGNTVTFRANFNTSTINVNTAGISGSGSVVVTSPTTPGAVHLNATGTYTGETTVNSGNLFVNATQGTGTADVVVDGTGNLRGTGSIAGALFVNSGGSLAPGGPAATGTLTVNNNVFLTPGANPATFRIRLTGLNGANFDSLTVGGGGTFSFNNATFALDTTGLTGTLAASQQFTIVGTSGGGQIAAGQQFLGLPHGMLVTTIGSTELRIAYDTGADRIFLFTPVPEPGWALAVVGVAALGRRVRRRG